MTILFYISIILALFITTTTGAYLGITQGLTAAFGPLCIYMVISEIKRKRIIWKQTYNHKAIIIILIGILTITFKSSIGQDYFKQAIYFLIIPMCISISFEDLSNSKISHLKKILLFFFLTECFLAIYERIFTINIFPIKELTLNEMLYSNPEDWEFRSTALLGHPLANAMAITTILSFILTGKFKISTKLFYVLIGYISLFCFNARGAIIISTILIIPYTFNLIKKNRHHKTLLYTISFLFLLAIGYLITNTSLGGRLLNMDKLLDGSAQTRLDVFEFYRFLNIDTLLLGSPDSYQYLTTKLEAGGVENGIIALIINWGLILTLIILPNLILFHYKKLSIYPFKDKIWIMAIFYILGTMNPNLATPTQWIIWIFSYYAFRPKKFKNTSL